MEYIFGHGAAVIRGNFDLSFPIFYQQDDVNKIVCENGLFSRI